MIWATAGCLAPQCIEKCLSENRACPHFQRIRGKQGEYSAHSNRCRLYATALKHSSRHQTRICSRTGMLGQPTGKALGRAFGVAKMAASNRDARNSRWTLAHTMRGGWLASSFGIATRSIQCRRPERSAVLPFIIRQSYVDSVGNPIGPNLAVRLRRED